MDRAFLSSTSGSAPTAPAAPSIGYPQSGNPVLAVPATKPGPWWYHMITEEQRAIIVAAGLTPDQNNITQVRDAVLMLTLSKRLSFSVNTTLTAAQVGSTAHATGSAALTLTLPDSSLTIDAGRFTVINHTTQALTIARAGTNTLLAGNSSGLTSLVLPTGADISLVLNKAAGVWLAEAGSALLPYTSIGAGQIIYHVTNTAPLGYLKANGAAISRTVYSALFAVIGTIFGAGDGTTTFNLPDLRGEFLRGWDDGRGVDTGRAFGSAQADLFKAHTHSALSALGIITSASGAGSVTANLTFGGGANFSNAASLMSEGGVETRPRNIALLACIKF